VRPYLAIVSARFRMLLQYRAAAWAGVATQGFWGLIRVMVFDAFYRSSSATQPMTLDQTVSYIWLGQATIGLLIFSVDADVRDMVRTGTVAYELARPVDLFSLWYWRSVASRAAPTLLRCMPIMVLAIALRGLGPPASVASGFAWVLSQVAALMLSAAVMTLATISLLWTVSGEGISRLLPMVAWLSTGIVIPLPLFPDWAQPILNSLPFAGMLDTPARVYMGHIDAGHASLAIARQLAWTLALVWLGRLLIARGTRRLVVQGG